MHIYKLLAFKLLVMGPLSSAEVLVFNLLISKIALFGFFCLILYSEQLLLKHHQMFCLSPTNHNTLLSLCWASI